MPEQEHDRSMGHANATLQMLQDANDEAGIDASAAIEDLTADRDTWDCKDCGRLHLSQSDAFRCCRGNGQGGDPA